MLVDMELGLPSWYGKLYTYLFIMMQLSVPVQKSSRITKNTFTLYGCSPFGSEVGYILHVFLKEET